MLSDLQLQIIGWACTLLGGFLCGLLTFWLIRSIRRFHAAQLDACPHCGKATYWMHDSQGGSWVRWYSYNSSIKTLVCEACGKLVTPRKWQELVDPVSDQKPPKPVPYASARGSKPPAPWVTREEMVDLAALFAVEVGTLNNRISALEAAIAPKPAPEPVQIYESPGVAEGYCLYHKGRTYMRYGGGAWYEPMHVEVVPACSKYIDPESPKYAELRSSWERWRAPEPLAPGVRVWKNHDGCLFLLSSDGTDWVLSPDDAGWRETGSPWTATDYEMADHLTELHGHERDEVVKDWMNRGNV